VIVLAAAAADPIGWRQLAALVITASSAIRFYLAVRRLFSNDRRDACDSQT